MRRLVTFIVTLGLSGLFSADALAGGATPTPLSCCNRTQVDRVVKEYLDLYKSLITHREADWQTSGEAYALAAETKKLVREGGLVGEERAVAEQLQRDVDAVKDGRAMGVRSRLDAISRGVIHIAENHPGGSRQLAEAFCPNVGAWLQETSAPLQNPYAADDCAEWR